jgi:hypothetical protein
MFGKIIRILSNAILIGILDYLFIHNAVNDSCARWKVQFDPTKSRNGPGLF